MARNPDRPRPSSTVLSKQDLLAGLRRIDESNESRDRVLRMETEFREHIAGHAASLPTTSASFSKFNTSPFVLMFHAMQQGYSQVSQIEDDILPARLFSSMETSAGRMVQDIVLPVYGWENVRSAMHSAGSVLDGRKRESGLLKLVTLKSGPRCLNDEMSKDLADDIVAHAEQWAEEVGVDHVDFTYGVLYGTRKQSNKKDWHILRNIVETRGTRFVLRSPRNRWDCSFRVRGIRVDVAVRIGGDWWSYLGGPHALIEMMCANPRLRHPRAGARRPRRLQDSRPQQHRLDRTGSKGLQREPPAAKPAPVVVLPSQALLRRHCGVILPDMRLMPSTVERSGTKPLRQQTA